MKRKPAPPHKNKRTHIIKIGFKHIIFSSYNNYLLSIISNYLSIYYKGRYYLHFVAKNIETLRLRSLAKVIKHKNQKESLQIFRDH